MKIGSMKSSGGGTRGAVVAPPSEPRVSRAQLDALYPGAYAATRRALQRRELYGPESAMAKAEAQSMADAIYASPGCPADTRKAEAWAADVARMLVKLIRTGAVAD